MVGLSFLLQQSGDMVLTTTVRRIDCFGPIPGVALLPGQEADLAGHDPKSIRDGFGAIALAANSNGMLLVSQPRAHPHHRSAQVVTGRHDSVTLITTCQCSSTHQSAPMKLITCVPVCPCACVPRRADRAEGGWHDRRRRTGWGAENGNTIHRVRQRAAVRR